MWVQRNHHEVMKAEDGRQAHSSKAQNQFK